MRIVPQALFIMEIIQEALANIGFNWQVALANFVNFLIIFWLLKRFAFGPIQEKIEERNQRIADGLKDAQEAQKKLAEAQEVYEQKLVEAKKEAHVILDAAQKEKGMILEYAHSEAEKKTADMIAHTEGVCAQREEDSKDEFKKYAAELSISIAEKIVGESLDEKKAKEVVDKTLKNHA